METDFTSMDTLVFKNGEKISISPATVVTSPKSHFKGLGEQSISGFTAPLVLYFTEPWLQHLVNFNFSFTLDIILVNEAGKVAQAFTQPMNAKNGSYLRGFSSLKMVLLCPEKFIAKHHIVRDKTLIELSTFKDYVLDYLDGPWKIEISKMTVEELKGRIESLNLKNQNDFAKRRYHLLLYVELEKKDTTKKEVFLNFIEEERLEIYFETLIIKVASINNVFGNLSDFAFEYQMDGYTNGKLFCIADMNLGSAYLNELVKDCLLPLGLKELEDFAIAHEQRPPSSPNCFGEGVVTFWHEEHPHLIGVDWLGSIIDENGNWIWYKNS